MNKIKKLAFLAFIPAILLHAEVKTEIKEQNIQRVQPIPVANIRYNSGLFQYSYFKTDKDGLKEYAQEAKLAPYRLKELYNRIDNPLSIVVSAYAYDYGYQRADLAENFYKLFPENKISVIDKVRYADFLLRTGRPDQIHNVLNKKDCMMSIHERNKCYYYLGLEKYLVEGDNKNVFLNLARDTIEQAKDIFTGKKY